MIPNVPQSTAVDARKKELRLASLAARKALTPEERSEKSAEIFKNLANLEKFKVAQSVFVYVNIGSEVETKSFIRETIASGKRVLVPYCKVDSRDIGIGEVRDLETDLLPGTLSILEPKAEVRDRFFKSDLQFIVCPGVAFDIYGGRVGRGRAYYDNFLKELKGKVPIVAVAFDCQVRTETVPFYYGDVSMDQVITESGLKMAYGLGIDPVQPHRRANLATPYGS